MPNTSTAETKVTEQPKKAPAIKVTDRSTLDYLERAKAAREARKIAPQVHLNGQFSIPQKEIIARFAREHGGQDGEFHFMFGDKELSDSYADRGYEPVIDQGKHYGYHGDPLWRIPTDMHHEDLGAVVAQSERVLKVRRTEKAEVGPNGQPAMQMKVETTDGKIVLDNIDESKL